MKTKKEIIEIECDICGKDISEEGYEKEGGLFYKAHAMGANGEPIASADRNYSEVCDGCIVKIGIWLDKFLKKRKK